MPAVRPPEDLDKVLVAQMALDEVQTTTIKFFRKVYPSLRRMINQSLTQAELAELGSLSVRAAKTHIDRLTREGYLQRDHYRGWRLPPKFPLTDPFYIAISRALI